MAAMERQEARSFIIVLQYVSPFSWSFGLVLMNQITRTPSITLGTAYRVRHVHEHEIAYIEANDPFDLLVIQDFPNDIFLPGAQLNFDCRDCVQPANVKRVPRRYLHQLPGYVSLRMVESSLKAVLRRVDSIACAMGNPTMNRMLPGGLNDQRRREDILTLNLLRTIDRVQQPVIVVQPPSGADCKENRKTSIWEQGTVPRNGGRG